MGAVSIHHLCLKLVYSKQPILGLTQEFCWVGEYVGGGGAFETMKLSGDVEDGVSEK